MLFRIQIYQALQYPNFRLFFIGQSLSLMGTWMQQVALGWLVYRLTYSPFLLGMVAFCAQAPMLFLGWWGGVVADRIPKRTLLLVTQAMSLVQAGVLAALTFSDTITVEQVMALSLLLGFITIFDLPARQAFFSEIVDRKDLPNAIALNSTMFNGARLVGPSIAGMVIAIYGEAVCFLVNSVSFVLVIGCLLLMRIEAKTSRKTQGSYFENLKDGVRYAWGTPSVKALLIMVAVVSLAGTPYTVLMPVFAGKVLHGGPDTLGWLMGAVGLGALIGALALAQRNKVEGLNHRVWGAAFLFGAVLVVFAFSSSLWLSLLILPIAGYGMVTQMASTNSILQTMAPDGMRGRVMGFYSMMFVGLTPVGSLVAGVMSDIVGVRWTVAICGMVCIMAGLIFRKMEAKESTA